MSMLFRNWLEPGYYVEDASGDLTRVDDPKEATHHHDGCSFNEITPEDIKRDDTKDDYEFSLFSKWKNE